jgi:hypothetical protein
MIEKFNGLTQHFTPASIGLGAFLLSQAAVGLVWLTRLESRITTLEGENKAQQLLLNRLDSKEHEFNLTVTREATIMRGNTESLRGDISRIQEQQQRIIQALDSTNNLIQEHLRSHPK